MQYRLRTLVILTAVGPPIIAVLWWMRSQVPPSISRMACLYAVSISLALLANAWQNRKMRIVAKAVEAENRRMRKAVEALNPAADPKLIRAALPVVPRHDHVLSINADALSAN